MLRSQIVVIRTSGASMRLMLASRCRGDSRLLGRARDHEALVLLRWVVSVYGRLMASSLLQSTTATSALFDDGAGGRFMVLGR